MYGPGQEGCHMDILLGLFLVLGIVAFAIFIFRAAKGVAGQVRPAIWVVLGVIALSALAARPRIDEPIRPQMCAEGCRIGAPGVASAAEQIACFDLCE